MRWYRLAAEQGYAGAQFMLGVMYATGEGVPGDDAEAVRWYRLAAEQGLARAQSNLGVMYDNGEGVPEDDAEAVRWYRLAVEQGYAVCAVHAGGHVRQRRRCPRGRRRGGALVSPRRRAGPRHGAATISGACTTGEGVPEDDTEAVRWYRLAAEQGHARAQYNLGARAQYNLGVMYANGEGVPEDDAEAVRWYRLAAEQGLARAQLFMYAKGEGVPEDDAEAVRWWRRAAEQGHASAPVSGSCTPKAKVSPKTQYMRTLGSALLQHKATRDAKEAKELVAKLMTQAQITEAQKRSRKYWTRYVVPFQ